MTSKLSEDRTSLIKLYTVFQTNRDIVTRNIRDTLKFCQGIIIALLGGSTIAAYYLGSANLLTFLFPLLAFIFSLVGFIDTKRNYSRFLNWAIVCWNIEELLGLHDGINHKKMKSIMPEFFRDKTKLERLSKIFKERFSYRTLFGAFSYRFLSSVRDTVFFTAACVFIAFMIASGALLLWITVNILSSVFTAFWASIIN